MSSRLLIAIGASALLALAACSPASAPSPTGTTVNVTLTDGMRIEPSTMSVPANVPVRFVVANSGVIEHEFFLGDEAEQNEHEEEMAHGGMGHGEMAGVMVAPGDTKELTFTFTPGEWLAGCHVPGHYPAGMMALITAQP